jgi:hypothetical protein
MSKNKGPCWNSRQSRWNSLKAPNFEPLMKIHFANQPIMLELSVLESIMLEPFFPCPNPAAVAVMAFMLPFVLWARRLIPILVWRLISRVDAIGVEFLVSIPNSVSVTSSQGSDTHPPGVKQKTPHH